MTTFHLTVLDWNDPLNQKYCFMVNMEMESHLCIWDLTLVCGEWRLTVFSEIFKWDYSGCNISLIIKLSEPGNSQKNRIMGNRIE